MVKLLFGFPLHDSFDAALDLYYSIKKFNNDPSVVFISNQDLGYSADKLTKLKSKRQYNWMGMHNFIFDVFEQIKDMDFDYYVNLDSDCLFANYGFEKIFEKKFDFNMDHIMTHYDFYNTKVGARLINKYENLLRKLNLDRKSMSRYFTGKFSRNIKYYEMILDRLNLERKDSRVLSCLGTSQIFSKRAVNFIAENTEKIENHPAFKKMAGLELMLYETFFTTLLKDAGFIPIATYPKYLPCLRFRPSWTTEEIKNTDSSKLAILYHPVKREPEDKFRKMIIKRTKLKQFIAKHD